MNDWTRHPMAPEGDPAEPPAAGGAAPAEPPAPAADGDPADPAPDEAQADGAADDVDALKAQVAALTADLEERQKAAEAAAAEAEAERKAKLTETERLAEEMAALKEQIAGERQQLVAKRRDLALDKLGVIDRYRGYAPDVDPSTAEGAAELEAWVKDRPEIVKAQSNAPGSGWRPKPQSALAKVLSGETYNPLVNKKMLKGLN